jgi:hypothetical protein
MLGGLFTSFLMELLIYPVIFYIAKSLTLDRESSSSVDRIVTSMAEVRGDNGEEPHA